MEHAPAPPRTLRLTDREVLLDQRVVVRADEVLDELTPLEAGLLGYLAARPDQIVERKVLLREVWGYAEQVNSRAVDKTVHRLRQKLEVDPTGPRHLLGLRALGYRLVLAEPAPDEVTPGAALVAEAEALDLQIRRGEARAARSALRERIPALLQLVDARAEPAPELAARALLALQTQQIRVDPSGYARRCDRILAGASGPWRHRLRACRAEAALFCGRLEEAAQDCRRVLAEAPASEAVARAHALLTLSVSGAWGGGDPEQLVRHLQEGLASLAGQSELRLEARISIALCRQYLDLGRYEVVVRAAEHSAAVLERSGDLELLGVALNHMAIGLSRLGRHAEEAAVQERALAVYREAGDRVGVSSTLSNLLFALLDVGDLPAAQRYMEDARVLADEAGTRHVLANTHEGAAFIALELGLYEKARHHFQVYQRLVAEGSTSRLTMEAHAYLALVAHLEGDLDRALAESDAADTLGESLPLPPQQRWLLLTRALLAAELGERSRLERAAERLRSPGPRERPKTAWEEAILAMAERILALRDAATERGPAELHAAREARPPTTGHHARVVDALIDAILQRIGG